MTELIIRRAGLGDLNAVAQVEAACFPPAEAASRDSLAKRLTAYGDSFLVAEQDGEIIGFINGMSNGFCVVIARYFGGNEHDHFQKAVYLSIFLSFITTIAITVFLCCF